MAEANGVSGIGAIAQFETSPPIPSEDSLRSIKASAKQAIPPNSGGAVSDVEATGPKHEAIAEWQQKNGIDRSKQIKLVKVAHMRYQHPDLDVISNFLLDFGMQIVDAKEDKVWYRGYGPDQYVYFAQRGEKKFLGGTFEVETYEDLEKYVKASDFRPHHAD